MTGLIGEPLSVAESAQRARIQGVVDRWLNGDDLSMWDVHPVGDAGLYFCEQRANPKDRLHAFVPWEDVRHSASYPVPPGFLPRRGRPPSIEM